jgi:hypothetical protein
MRVQKNIPERREIKEAKNGILPVAVQRAKLQSSTQPNRTIGEMQPLG